MFIFKRDPADKHAASAYLKRNQGKRRPAWPTAEERAALRYYFAGKGKRLDTSPAGYDHTGRGNAAARRRRQQARIAARAK